MITRKALTQQASKRVQNFFKTKMTSARYVTSPKCLKDKILTTSNVKYDFICAIVMYNNLDYAFSFRELEIIHMVYVFLANFT